MQRTSSKGNLHLVELPKEYTLSGGHVKFFYNKGLYLERRFIDLFQECLRRGLRMNHELYETRLEKIRSSFPLEWYNDYSPSDEAYKIVIERIKERIYQKPHLYPDKCRFLAFCNHKSYYKSLT